MAGDVFVAARSAQTHHLSIIPNILVRRAKKLTRNGDPYPFYDDGAIDAIFLWSLQEGGGKEERWSSGGEVEDEYEGEEEPLAVKDRSDDVRYEAIEEEFEFNGEKIQPCYCVLPFVSDEEVEGMTKRNIAVSSPLMTKLITWSDAWCIVQ